MSSWRLLSQMQHMYIVYILYISLAEDVAICCAFNFKYYEYVECIIYFGIFLHLFHNV